jgi:NitT/TauT family transport system ATP-binding protein
MSRAGESNRLDVNIKRKSYRAASGGRRHVLGQISLGLNNGEVAALVGPSGCGKTTLLRIIVGLDQDFEGSVRLPAFGKLGVIFQEPRLLPWRTVEENVKLVAPQADEATLGALFVTLGIAEHRRHYPGELSLGQARRVALARAFAVKPDLLVLDEPFVSLDTALAARMRAELFELVSRQPVTTLLVTHNIDEAIEIADRVVLLSPAPACLIGDVRIENPRGVRTPEEVAAIRDEIVNKIAVVRRPVADC